MIVRIITCKVRPDAYSAFEAATLENHRGSVAEPGVLRFDVLQDNARPDTYYLYEVYRNDAAAAAHKETDHYKQWRQSVAGYMAEARTSVACSVLAPVSETQW